MNSFLLLVVFATVIVFSSLNNQAFAESPSIFVTRDGFAKVSETFDVKTTVSRFDVTPLGKTITDIFAYDENNVVLKTDFDGTKIRIESLGASKVNLDYNSDVLYEENGLWNVEFESSKTTILMLPDSSDLVKINAIPIKMDEKQIVMPPGNISISYTLRTVISNNFQLDDSNSIGVMTSAQIRNFEANPNNVSFQLIDKNPVLLILPKSFVSEPPQIMINQSPVTFDQYYQNSTHHWIGIEPFESGIVEISLLSPTIDTHSANIQQEPVPTISEEPILTDLEPETSEGGGCLIATATFGSELAPQVQLLREIRDTIVLDTSSGTYFMSGFNSLYYSFSPHIADLERQNPIFKEIIKIGLTPMLYSLSFLSVVDIESEHEMLGYGIGVILINIGMYVMPIFALIKSKSFIARILNH